MIALMLGLILVLLGLIVLVLLFTDAGKRAIRGMAWALASLIVIVLVSQRVDQWESAGYVSGSNNAVVTFGVLALLGAGVWLMVTGWRRHKATTNDL